MSQIYTVAAALDIARTMAKGVPLSRIEMLTCDTVSAKIYRAYPWRITLKTSPDNWTEVSLVDGTQDYATGLTDIFRFTQFWIRRTDVSPNEVRNLTVVPNCTIDLIKKSPYAIRQIAYQAGVNKFRLESAVQVASGTTWKLGGEYQPQHTRLTDVSDSLWMNDQFLDVYAKELAAWALFNEDDKVGCSMLRKEAETAINEMAQAEDFGSVSTYYPDDPIGVVDARRYYSNDVYPII